MTARTTATVKRKGDNPFELVFTLSLDVTHWICAGHQNDIIFEHLCLPKHAYCSEFYATQSGSWPSVTVPMHPDKEDRHARLINAMRHFKEYGCTVEIIDEAGGVVESKPKELIDKFFDL